MNHLLLTRFNVKHRELRDWTPTGLDADWLAHRVPLFERICAPSVRGQTTDHFQWLVFVHPATPPPFRDRIADAVASAGGSVVWSAEGTAEEVVERCPEGDLLLTTRLDNDDAIARDHLERVALEAVRQASDAPFFLNFPMGCQLQHPMGTVNRRPHRRSPFLTYVESGTPVTVWGFGTHVYLDDAPPIRQIGEDRPFWMQTIHGRNLSNPAILQTPMSDREVSRWFSIDDTVLRRTTALDLAVRRVAVTARRASRTARRAIRRVVRP